MNIPPALAQQLLGKLTGLAGRVLGTAASPCGAPGCTLRSIGFLCSVCETPLCTDHATITVSNPPQGRCAPCQMSNWALPGGDAEPTPKPKRKKKRVRR